MYIFKIAQVISENVRIAFPYVLSIQYFKRVTHLAIIAILPCGSMLQAYYVKRSFSHDAAHILLNLPNCLNHISGFHAVPCDTLLDYLVENTHDNQGDA